MAACMGWQQCPHASLEHFKNDGHVLFMQIVGVQMNHVLEGGIRFSQNGFQTIEDLFGLGPGIVGGDDITVLVDRHAPCGVDRISDQYARCVAGRGVDMIGFQYFHPATVASFPIVDNKTEKARRAFL